MSPLQVSPQTARPPALSLIHIFVQPQGEGVGIAAATFGRVQDYQVKDINNMGAAMAPAAASTLLHYFKAVSYTHLWTASLRLPVVCLKSKLPSISMQTAS